VLRQPRSSYALCVRDRGYRASLELRKAYRQIADAWARGHGLVRIVDESGEDYLHPRHYFVSIPIPKSGARGARGGNHGAHKEFAADVPRASQEVMMTAS